MNIIDLILDNIKAMVYDGVRYTSRVVVFKRRHRMADWRDLTSLAGGEPFVVERVRLKETGFAIEGEFDLPPLFSLKAEEQVFVAAFVKCHGSIKEMERLFGISYPTVKNRLNAIGSRLDFVDIAPDESPDGSGEDVLGMLERGEISVDEAVERFRG